MAETAAPPRPADQGDRGPAHDEHFFLWTGRHAALVRAGQLELTDRENIALEFETMGYPIARATAAGATGLALRTLSSRCPYPADQILDDTDFPAVTEDE